MLVPALKAGDLLDGRHGCGASRWGVRDPMTRPIPEIWVTVCWRAVSGSGSDLVFAFAVIGRFCFLLLSMDGFILDMY